MSYGNNCCMNPAELMISLADPQNLCFVSVSAGLGSGGENRQSSLGIEHVPHSRYVNVGLINYARAHMAVCRQMMYQLSSLNSLSQ